MFLHDAGVLHWHEPPGEWNHFRAEPDVRVVKRCLPRRGLGHARNVAQVGAIDLNRSRAVRGTAPTLKTKRVNLTLPHLMTLLDKLERRFGFLGTPGLTRIIRGFAML